MLTFTQTDQHYSFTFDTRLGRAHCVIVLCQMRLHLRIATAPKYSAGAPTICFEYSEPQLCPFGRLVLWLLLAILLGCFCLFYAAVFAPILYPPFAVTVLYELNSFCFLTQVKPRSLSLVFEDALRPVRCKLIRTSVLTMFACM